MGAKKSWFIILLIMSLLLSGLQGAAYGQQNVVNGQQLPSPADITAYSDRWSVVPKLTQTPVIDGALSAGEWDGIRSLANFVNFFTNLEADPATEVKLAYSDTHVYFAVRGKKAVANEAPELEGFEIVIRPDPAQESYYRIPVTIANTNGKKLASELGPTLGLDARKAENVVVQTVQGANAWTAEIAVPIGSLGIQQMASGKEWGLNIIRYRPDLSPASSWVPIRNASFTDKEYPNTYMTYAAVTEQGRMGRLFFDELPNQLAGTWPGTDVVSLEPEDLNLKYNHFSEKTLSFTNTVYTPNTQVQLNWKMPSGRVVPIEQAALSIQGDRVEIRFTHPGMVETGLYQLELILKEEIEDTAWMTVVSIDNEHVIAAGEKAMGWVPAAGIKTVVAEVPASAEVSSLLTMIPDKVGIFWAGLPEQPHLEPWNLFNWDPARPDELTSDHSPGVTYPNAQYPENKVIQVQNGKGETVEYPYYEDSSGKRYFFTAHTWYKKREYVTQQVNRIAAADPLGAARLIHRFAEVYQGYVPVYDTVWNNRPIDARTGPPHPYWGGLWNWWYCMDFNTINSLADAYAYVKQTNAFDILSDELGVDVEHEIVEELFKPSVEFVRSYRVMNGNMDYHIWRGLVKIGNAIDYPDYVHETIELIENYVANHFLFDGYWKELSISYHEQSLGGIGILRDMLTGWSDPAGYVSQRTGVTIDQLSLDPILKNSLEIGNLLSYPNGNYLPMGDTWAADKTPTPNTAAGSYLLPASGVGRLAKGDGTQQSQLYMSFGPKYGHHHFDPLNLMLYANGQELLPDIGYTVTKHRNWSVYTLSHNTVVVDGKDANVTGSSAQGGNVEVFAPGDGKVQVMKSEQKNAYPGITSDYIREPWYISFPDSDEGYVLDLFRISGGSSHEYTLQGDANRDASFTALGGLDLQPSGSELTPPGLSGVNEHAYTNVRNVSRAALSDNKYELLLSTSDNGTNLAGMKLTGLVDPGNNELFIGESPSLRMTRTSNLDNNNEADLYTMPKMVVRRQGTNLSSTFITAMEPFAAGSSARIGNVERLTPEQAGDVAVAITYGDTKDIILSTQRTDSTPLVVGDIRLYGKMGFIRMENDVVTNMMLIDGTRLEYGNDQVDGDGAVTGVIEEVYRKANMQSHNAFVTSASVPLDAKGSYMIVTHPDGQSHGYKIEDVVNENGKTMIRIDGEPGFEVYPDGTSKLKFYPSTSWTGAHTFRIANVTIQDDPAAAVESVTLSAEQADLDDFLLVKGESAQLTANAAYSNLTVTDVTYEPGVWQSSNPQAATVDNGLVTATGSGQTDITASFGGKTAQVSLTVLEDGELTMTGISSTMAVGEQGQIKVWASNGQELTEVTASSVVVSSAPDVASVDAAGQVHALKAGTTVISATYGYYAPAAFEVTVREQASNALLRDLKVNGATVTGFSSSVEAYTLQLAAGTQIVPAVIAVTDDSRASAVVNPASSLPGTTTITVTAEDNVTQKTYTLHFTVASPPGNQGGNENPPENSSRNPSDQLNGNPKDGEQPDPSLAKPSTKPSGKRQILRIEEGHAEVAISRDTWAESNELDIVQGGITLHLSSKAFEALLQRLNTNANKDDLTDLLISISADQGDKAKQALAQAGQQAKAELTEASPVYQFLLSGMQRNETFNPPLPISIVFDPEADKQLLGVYRIQDNGELEYLGGKVSGDRIEALLTGPGEVVVVQLDKQFHDVPTNHWAHRMLKEMAAHHLVAGVSAEQFLPSRLMTRAEFTALLARALDLEEKPGSSFEDVKAADWYAGYVTAAAEAGLVQGLNGATFAPDRMISREEMAVMLVRAYEWKQEKAAEAASIAEFSDQDQASEWARQALAFAQKLGLVSGRGDNRFIPQGMTTRAEGAQAVYNLLNLYKIGVN
ncbi:S-layer homology domain-containing protein [Paenibacillus eucommiae]|uniref:SLH domain-containing protein n=1 Tax=Paenibacillus eucommiae TaxID=1355755 RepID=A0ABS4IWL3_9BACL|nr:S-layer homology domain-containing protein [Paenibacillus eucommiae]MBP1991973.1 hypothetical protein [Paenibacillus eucommiae]